MSNNNRRRLAVATLRPFFLFLTDIRPHLTEIIEEAGEAADSVTVAIQAGYWWRELLTPEERQQYRHRYAQFEAVIYYKFPACSTARLVLYKRDASPPSNAVRMMGAILGLQFDYVEPDLMKGEHKSPAYRKINPMSTIPVLKDGNLTVSDSHAINLYLLNKYGGEHKETLYPSDPATRAIVDQCLYFDAGVLFRQILEVSRPSFMGKATGPTSRNIEGIEEGYAVIEAYLQTRAYVAADHVTVADISLASTVAALQGIHAVDANKFPKTKAWLERLSSESYFKEINTPGAILLAKMLRHSWKNNKQE